MRKNWKNNLWMLGIFSLLLVLSNCGQNETHTHAAGEEYTCPMHPQIVQDKPGACPICGMDLVKKGGTGSNDTLSADLDYLLRPTNEAVVSSISTVKLQSKQMDAVIRAEGSIAYDTRRIYNIAARFGGRIEKLYVKYTYQPVSKGQKLFDIYSPELVTAQRELLFLLENDPANTGLIGAARQKLSLLGLTSNQIQGIEKSRKAAYTLSVYSPYNGYVVEEAALPEAPALTASSGGSQSSMGGMDASAPTTSMRTTAQVTGTAPNGEISLREGMYVNAGQSLFKVVNTEVVWGIFSMYPDNIASVRIGQPVEIVVESDSTRSIKGKVDFIDPFYREGATLPSFRVNISTKNNTLPIGSLLAARISIPKEALWLPAGTILDLGEKQIAYLKEGEIFSPVAVTTGQRVQGWIEILGGLSEEQVLAADAQFMTDSESFIKVKNNERTN